MPKRRARSPVDAPTAGRWTCGTAETASPIEPGGKAGEDGKRREDMQHIVRFDKKDSECETRLARFMAQLIREGITYRIRQDAFEYEVELTGGY